MNNRNEKEILPVLARWHYTKEEWYSFEKWTKRRIGFFSYLFHRIIAGKRRIVPEITVTREEVAINDLREPFHDTERAMKTITIRDAGAMNVMEITYQQENAISMREIHIPVPRGKLREAIELQIELERVHLA